MTEVWINETSIKMNNKLDNFQIYTKMVETYYVGVTDNIVICLWSLLLIVKII